MKVDLVFIEQAGKTSGKGIPLTGGEDGGEFAALLNQALAIELSLQEDPEAEQQIYESSEELQEDQLPSAKQLLQNTWPGDVDERGDASLGVEQQSGSSELMLMNLFAGKSESVNSESLKNGKSGPPDQSAANSQVVAGKQMQPVQQSGDAQAGFQATPGAEKVEGMEAPAAGVKEAELTAKETEKAVIAEQSKTGKAGELAGAMKPAPEKEASFTAVANGRETPEQPGKEKLPDLEKGNYLDRQTTGKTGQLNGIETGESKSENVRQSLQESKSEVHLAGKVNKTGSESTESKVREADLRVVNRSTVPPQAENSLHAQSSAIQGDQALRSEAVLQADRTAGMRETVLQQVEGKLVYLRESGTAPAEMRLTLHPPELGEVTIRVFSKQGKMSATVLAESALVKEILESSITELRQRVNFVDIQFEQLDFSSSNNQSDHSGKSARRFEGQFLNRAGPAGEEMDVQGDLSGNLQAASQAERNAVDYWA